MLEIPLYAQSGYNVIIDYEYFYKDFNINKKDIALDKKQEYIDNKLVNEYNINTSTALLKIKQTPINDDLNDTEARIFNTALIKYIKDIKSFKRYQKFIEGLNDMTGKTFKEGIMELIQINAIMGGNYKGIMHYKNKIFSNENPKKQIGIMCICGKKHIKQLGVFRISWIKNDIILGCVCNDKFVDYINIEEDEEIRNKLKLLHENHILWKRKLNNHPCISCDTGIVRFALDNKQQTYLKTSHCIDCIARIKQYNLPILIKCKTELCDNKIEYGRKYNKCIDCWHISKGNIKKKYNF